MTCCLDPGSLSTVKMRTSSDGRENREELFGGATTTSILPNTEDSVAPRGDRTYDVVKPISS